MVKILRLKAKQYKAKFLILLFQLLIFIFFISNLAFAADTGFVAGGSATNNSGYTNWTAANLTSADGSAFAGLTNASGSGDVYGFGLNLGSIDSIDGIEVTITAREGHGGCNAYSDIQLSWDNGSTWTSAIRTPAGVAEFATSFNSYTAGGSSELWGRASWSQSEVEDYLRVRVVTYNSRTANSVDVDYAAVKVYYTPHVNVAPSFSGNVTESDDPGVLENDITFQGTASDPESDSWYLAVCNTDSVTAGTPPTCGGGAYCVSSSAASSGSSNSCVWNATSTGEKSWYAFACDNNASPQCSAANTANSPLTIIDSPTILSTANQAFELGQAATAISSIRITDSPGGNITAANDIRIAIATTSVDMRWNVSDTSASLSGTAFTNNRVTNTAVSYEGDGAILVIQVTADFQAGEYLDISGLSLADFNSVNSAVSVLELHLGGSWDTEPDDTDNRTVTIYGTLASDEHSLGQVTNKWASQTSTTTIHYRYSLVPEGEGMTLGTTTFNLSGISGLSSSDLSDALLYRDKDNNGTVSFTSATDPDSWAVIDTSGSIYEYIYSILYDSFNDVLYAGGGIHSGDGDILRCPYASTGGCDEASNWTVLNTSGNFYENIYSIVYDSSNDVLYAGAGLSYGEGDILRCPYASTGGCDEASDWTVLNTGGTTYEVIYHLAYDSNNDVLYAGAGSDTGDGDILRCPNASTGGCDEASDWTVLNTGGTTYEVIYHLAYDSNNDVLYAGAGSGSGEGDILRCPNVSTGGCDEASEWTVLDTGGSTYELIISLTYDFSNDVLYAGAGWSTGDGDILRCPNASTGGCDQASDWTIIDTGGSTYEHIRSLAYDSVNDVLYAGAGSGTGDGDILRCPNASTGGCDQAGDWTIIDTGGSVYEGIFSLAYDSINNVIYAGGGGQIGGTKGDILRFGPGDLLIGQADIDVSGTAGSLTFATSAAYSIPATSTDFIIQLAASNLASGDMMTIDFGTAEAIGLVSGHTITLSENSSAVTHAYNPVTISSAANQVFGVNQASTTNSAIRITALTDTAITDANELYIAISTTTHDFRFYAGDTSVTITGTASDSVNDSSVAFISDSVLMITVTDDNFDTNEYIDISGLTYHSFGTAVNSAGALKIYAGGNYSVTADAIDDKTVIIYGALSSGEHTLGQVTNKWASQTSTTTVHYRYSLVPEGEGMKLGTTTFSLSGISGVGESDISNINIYFDIDGDGTINSSTTDWSKLNSTIGTFVSGDTGSITSVYSMAVVNGTLYIGTSKSSGAEVYRYDGGTNWTKVSHATAGTIAAGGTSGINAVQSMVDVNGTLYIGTYKSSGAEVYRYDGGTNWTKVSHATAGTIAAGGTSGLNYVNSMVNLNGSLYIGVGMNAEVYRYDGGTSWTKVSQAVAGTIQNGGTSEIENVTSMVAYNNTLYIGVENTTNFGMDCYYAEVYRYDGGTSWTKVSQSTPGNIKSGGTTGICQVAGMVVSEEFLYIGTGNVDNAEVYRYDGGTNWTVISSTTPGVIAENDTNNINAVRGMAVVNDVLYLGTSEPNKVEIYRYDGGTSWTKVSQTTPGNIGLGDTSGIDYCYDMINYNNFIIVSVGTNAEVYRYNYSYPYLGQIEINGSANRISFSTSTTYSISTTTDFLLELTASNLAENDLMTIDFGTAEATGNISGYTITLSENSSAVTHAYNPVSISSAADQAFEVGQASTSNSVIRITALSDTAITNANEIYVTIATSTHDFRFYTGDTSVTISGTASDSVNNTAVSFVSDSVMVITVTDDNFDANEYIDIAGLTYHSFGTAVNSAGALKLYTGGTYSGTADAIDDKTVTIYGALSSGEHTLGQVTNKWASQTSTTTVHYRYSLVPEGEGMTLGTTTFGFSGISGVLSSDLSDAMLYWDKDKNGIVNFASTTDPDSWAVLDTGGSTYEEIYSLAYDSANDVLYAGTGYDNGEGDILRCPNLSTGGCDEASDWTVLDTGGSTYEEIYSLAYDSVNDVLYAGTGAGVGEGDILRCPNLSTGGCDQAGDWTVLDTGSSGYERIVSLAYDSVHDVLYAGTGFNAGDGDILRCLNLSTGGCDEASDWIVLDTGGSTYEEIFSLAYDSGNDVLYAGAGFNAGDGDILRCPNASTGSWDQAGDCTVLDTGGSTYEGIYSLAYDTMNDVLYAGAGYDNGDGDILRCPNLSTGGCDQAGDWTVLDTGISTYEIIYSLAYDFGNGVLYAGAGWSTGFGDILRFDPGDLLIGQADIDVSGTAGSLTFATSAAYSIPATSTDFIIQLAASNLIACDTLTIDFDSASTTGLVSGWTIEPVDDSSSATHLVSPGSLTVSNHSAGQIEDVWGALTGESTTDIHFRFRLDPGGDSMSLGTTTVSLSSVSGVESADITAIKLYLDADSDGIVSVGDTQVNGNGSISIVNGSGSIIFATSSTYALSSITDYIIELAASNLVSGAGGGSGPAIVFEGSFGMVGGLGFEGMSGGAADTMTIDLGTIESAYSCPFDYSENVTSVTHQR